MNIIKIIIDDSWEIISEWRRGNIPGDIILKGRDVAHTFERIVEDILTKSQYNQYVQNDTRRVFTISDKRYGILMDYKHGRK